MEFIEIYIMDDFGGVTLVNIHKNDFSEDTLNKELGNENWSLNKKEIILKAYQHQVVLMNKILFEYMDYNNEPIN